MNSSQLSSQHSPNEIIQRLEELRKWQEEQQEKLINKQAAQRKLLSIEQQKMYEMLGISEIISSSAEDLVDSNSKEQVQDPNGKKSRENTTENATASVRPPVKINKKAQDGTVKSKKTFLKRGQGLTKRFGVNPDAFRLDNLPKYKYAARRSFPKESNDAANPVKHVKFSNDYGRLKLLQTNNNNIQKEEGNAETISPKSSNGIKDSAEDDDAPVELLLDWKERSEIQSEQSASESIKTAIDSVEKCPTISWAEVLDPKNIEPIVVRRILNETDVDKGNISEDLSLFELLEQKAADGSINFDVSLIQKWINERTIALQASHTLNEDTDFHVDEAFKKKVTVSPLPCDIDEKIAIDDSTDDDQNSEDEEHFNGMGNKNHVRFSDQVLVNEVETDFESLNSSAELKSVNVSNTSTPNEKTSFEEFKAKLFETTVTNSDAGGHQTIRSQNDSDFVLLEDLQTIVHEKQLIQEQKQDILEKSEALKLRLADLQKEIGEFQNHNAELIKLKQEHELEKIKIDQERIEMEEKLKDEKIKLEIYLHDERMKIDAEKKKYEKLLKEFKAPNRKEREEILNLREQVEELQKENRNKENKHIAAQSRLRAQIRNLEKDIKELSFEVDHLKKDNKKLEGENLRLNRMNNNKMLQEINKSIAKLAPKMQPEVTEVRNKNPKTVVARVITHRKTSSNKTRSKSVPNVMEETDSENELQTETSSQHSEEGEDRCHEPEIKDGREFRRNYREKVQHQNLSTESDQIQPSANHPFFTEDRFKREINNPDGSKDIWYTNGNLKKVSADSMNIRMLYYNKDIKETNIAEGTVKYYYAETNTWQTTYLDGLEILEFPNGQTEHRYKDGTVEVHFANGSIRITNPKDTQKVEEWKYPDGTNLVQLKSGDKILSLPNGQKEIHTKAHKRREYPDGTVKLVYPDGSQETRYSNGRVRLKDKNGTLVMDSETVRQ